MAAQVFDDTWACVAESRVETPETYPALVGAVADLVRWSDADSIGIASAGLVDPRTGVMSAANLALNGHRFPADLAQALGQQVPLINDARAMVLAEAVFGAGRTASRVIGLTLGTGVGGGATADGALLAGQSGLGGEFGHMAAPADVVAKWNLPLVTCGCGRVGCIETLISGPGLTRLADHLLGFAMSPRHVAEARDDTALPVWRAWCELVARHVSDLCLAFGPEMVVLGGGLSKVAGIAEDVAQALSAVHLPGVPVPKVTVATGGDAAGAKGAAYFATQSTRHHG